MILRTQMLLLPCMQIRTKKRNCIQGQFHIVIYKGIRHILLVLGKNSKKIVVLHI